MAATHHRSLHGLLGGGAVADVLLWRRRNVSAAAVAGATVVWFLFERAGYSLPSVLSNALLLLVVILFFWAKSASLLNRLPDECSWLPDECSSSHGCSRLPDECSSNHGLSNRWMTKQCEQDKIIQLLEEEIGILKQEIMSLKCEVEKMHGAYVEAKDMLRVVRKFLSYFKPPSKASGSVISFFLSEGNTDAEIAYFRDFFSCFVPPERLK